VHGAVGKKRGRGRPPGSKNKPKVTLAQLLPTLLTPDSIAALAARGADVASIAGKLSGARRAASGGGDIVLSPALLESEASIAVSSRRELPSARGVTALSILASQATAHVLQAARQRLQTLLATADALLAQLHGGAEVAAPTAAAGRSEGALPAASVPAPPPAPALAPLPAAASPRSAEGGLAEAEGVDARTWKRRRVVVSTDDDGGGDAVGELLRQGAPLSRVLRTVLTEGW